MNKYIVFYAGQLLDECGEYPHPSICPDGAFMYSVHTRQWFWKRWGTWHGANLPDIPKELQMWCLLL